MTIYTVEVINQTTVEDDGITSTPEHQVCRLKITPAIQPGKLFRVCLPPGLFQWETVFVAPGESTIIQVALLSSFYDEEDYMRPVPCGASEPPAPTAEETAAYLGDRLTHPETIDFD